MLGKAELTTFPEYGRVHLQVEDPGAALYVLAMDPPQAQQFALTLLHAAQYAAAHPDRPRPDSTADSKRKGRT